MNARHDKQFGVYKGKQSMCTSTMTFNSPPDRILPWIMVIGGLAIREILFFLFPFSFQYSVLTPIDSKRQEGTF